jgi:23S rRNA (pseudouridine1915-N3)-methyltransferase
MASGRQGIMKIRIVCVGKTRNPHLAALCEDYLVRLSHFINCELIVLRESTRSSTGLRSQVRHDEEQRIIEKISASPCSILLDVGGTETDSTGFVEKIRQKRLQGIRQMDFILGGPWGWTEKIRNAATERLTLSRLTLPHELARVVLLEQLYRAMTRLHGVPYDK